MQQQDGEATPIALSEENIRLKLDLKAMSNDNTMLRNEHGKLMTQVMLYKLCTYMVSYGYWIVSLLVNTV